MAQRFGTITLLFFFGRVLRYYARNRVGISSDPSISAGLFGLIDTCLDSIQACHDAIKAALPVGD